MFTNHTQTLNSLVPEKDIAELFIDAKQARKRIQTIWDQKVVANKKWLKQHRKNKKYMSHTKLGYATELEMQKSQEPTEWNKFEHPITSCCKRLLTKSYKKILEKKKNPNYVTPPKPQARTLIKDTSQTAEMASLHKDEQTKSASAQVFTNLNTRIFCPSIEPVRQKAIDSFLGALGNTKRFENISFFSDPIDNYTGTKWEGITEPKENILHMLVLFMDYLQLNNIYDCHSSALVDINSDYRNGWRALTDCGTDMVQTLLMVPYDIHVYYRNCIGKNQWLDDLITCRRYCMDPLDSKRVWFVEGAAVNASTVMAGWGSMFGVWKHKQELTQQEIAALMQDVTTLGKEGFKPLKVAALLAEAVISLWNRDCDRYRSNDIMALIEHCYLALTHIPVAKIFVVINSLKHEMLDGLRLATDQQRIVDLLQLFNHHFVNIINARECLGKLGTFKGVCLGANTETLKLWVPFVQICLFTIGNSCKIIEASIIDFRECFENALTKERKESRMFTYVLV